MADHIREQCMDAVVAAVTGLTTTGTRVFPDNVFPLTDDDLPGLNVVLIGDSINPETMPAPRLLTAAIDIDITAYCKGATASVARTQLNLIHNEVAAGLYADRTLGGAAFTITNLQNDFEWSGEMEKPGGSLRMRFQVFTAWYENDPTVRG